MEQAVRQQILVSTTHPTGSTSEITKGQSKTGNFTDKESHCAIETIYFSDKKVVAELRSKLKPECLLDFKLSTSIGY